MEIDVDTTVGRIAAEHPAATRVFERHGLDYCCGGGSSLAVACAERDLDAESLLREIERESEAASARTEADASWLEASEAELIAHIVRTFHEPLRRELPRLDAMARKVASVHSDRAPERLPALAAVVSELAAELEDHMADEERVVFPRILAATNGGATADTPDLTELEDEHREAGAALERIRELTGDFVVPEGACGTWRALWAGLEELEKAMHQHVHLENNVLFPRVLAG